LRGARRADQAIVLVDDVEEVVDVDDEDVNNDSAEELAS
jgi:hypothetical protein